MLFCKKPLHVMGERWLLQVTTVLFVSWCVTGGPESTVLSELTSSACFNQSQKTLTLTCPEGQMVKVNRLFHGHSDAGKCGYTAGDCVLEKKDMNPPCMGRHVCDMNLPSGEAGMVLHSCKLHTTYTQIQYQCIPESFVFDICEHSELSLQKGYLKTPRYPNNYPNSMDCTLRIHTDFPDQSIHLYAIDLSLESSSPGCGDWLHVFDGYGSFTTCSERTRTQLLVTMDNWLELQFHSNAQSQRKGVWLYYEASPQKPRTTAAKITMTTGHPPQTGNESLPLVGGSQEETTDDKAGKDIYATTGVTPKSVHIIYAVDSNFPIGLTVGVLLGILLCVMVVLLIILILRRRKAKLSSSQSCSSSVGFLDVKKSILNNIVEQPLAQDISDKGLYYKQQGQALPQDNNISDKCLYLQQQQLAEEHNKQKQNGCSDPKHSSFCKQHAGDMSDNTCLAHGQNELNNAKHVSMHIVVADTYPFFQPIPQKDNVLDCNRLSFHDQTSNPQPILQVCTAKEPKVANIDTEDELGLHKDNPRKGPFIDKNEDTGIEELYC